MELLKSGSIRSKLREQEQPQQAWLERAEQGRKERAKQTFKKDALHRTNITEGGTFY